MSKLLDNKYKFIKDLGQGGFGKVFLAQEEHSENLVAIKQLKTEGKQAQSNIIHEMQVVSKFNHPNIVMYKHHFKQENILYLVMEYCHVGSLRDLMQKEKITSTFVWKWIDTLTETLQFVHERDIIHHDIKPDNILFTENRVIKISDFGVANTSTGTPQYMSPEALKFETGVIKDPRVDIYALGVSLLEMLTKKNPFRGKSLQEIIEIHENRNFGITVLPDWQQEIILKAINIIPELRFQSMKDFNEAIRAKSVPIIFDKEVIQSGDLAEKASHLLNQKKWIKAKNILDYAEKNLKPNVNIFLQKGKYFLLSNQTELAKSYFEKALKWNPRLDVQKQLGWINLELKNYPTAISLLSDYLHRNPSDYEAYNLLLQCYYETGRYEPAIELAKTFLSIQPNNICFGNNLYICLVLKNIGKIVYPSDIQKIDNYYNPFLDYNFNIILESLPTHDFTKKPTLKSKLLFMDYRFNKFSHSTLFYTIVNGLESSSISRPIIALGRKGFDVNDIQVPGGTTISRRHCILINWKDDIWLYDLDSTGTYVNGERVIGKVPLIGKNLVRIGLTEFEFTNDKGKLF